MKNYINTNERAQVYGKVSPLLSASFSLEMNAITFNFIYITIKIVYIYICLNL